eukprot:m.80636 g.80636  ORF g.80636 m.80636 type:complete len:67 (-) comp16300_c0_seq2:1557-1757(-)
MDAPVNDKGGDAARKGKLVVAITAFALGAIFVFGVNNAPALIYGRASQNFNKLPPFPFFIFNVLCS